MAMQNKLQSGKYRSILECLMRVDPEPGTIPMQAKLTVSAYYIIYLTSAIAILPTIYDNFTAGGTFIASMQAVYFGLLTITILVLILFRRLSYARTLFSLSILVITTAIIADAGGIRGLGLLYFIAGYPIMYFILGYRGGILTPLFIFTGVILRLQFGNFHDLSIFNQPGYSRNYSIILGVATVLGVLAVVYQHLLIKYLSATAYTDEITGLQNRRTAEIMLDRMFMKGRTGIAKGSVIAVKLQHFSRINSNQGTSKSDDILRIFSRRLSQSIPDVLLTARYTGTVFLAVTRVHDLVAIDQLAHQLLRVLQEPVEIDSGSFSLQLNLIITRFPDDGANQTRILSNIMTSISRSEHGSGVVQYYDEKVHLAEKQRFLLSEELRHAIEQQELSIVYHPKINLHGETCAGAEILLRWHNNRHGSIPPDVFIPLAEELGIIREITHWVVRQALTQLKELQQRLPFLSRELVHAINLSPLDLSNPQFSTFLENLVQDNAVPTNQIEFEITERVLMDDNPTVQNTLERIRELGFRLAIDDFGTGYSSLSYLHRLKINNLKVDKSFVSQLQGAGNTQPIVKAIISMAQSLNLEVTAEGVETQQQADHIRDEGGRFAQGWLYARPMSLNAYIEWLVEHNSNKQSGQSGL